MSGDVVTAHGKLRTIDAAAYVGLAVQTLAKLRVTGGGPPYAKLGRAVVYEREALDQWVADHAVRSTSELAARGLSGDATEAIDSDVRWWRFQHYQQHYLGFGSEHAAALHCDQQSHEAFGSVPCTVRPASHRVLASLLRMNAPQVVIDLEDATRHFPKRLAEYQRQRAAGRP